MPARFATDRLEDARATLLPKLATFDNVPAPLDERLLEEDLQMASPASDQFHGFESYHREVLPPALARRATRLPKDYVKTLSPFGVRERESGSSFTYLPDPADGRLTVVEGDAEADTVIELDTEHFIQLTQDLESAAGLVYGDQTRSLRGDLMNFLQWEPALRWAYRDRPVYDPANVDLRDASGRVLDPTRSFTPDDDPAEMAEFLRVVGFIWIRDVLAADEVARLQEDAKRLHEAAREGDQESWWGKNERGETLLCRVLRAGKEPHIRALHGDPRLERYAELCEVPMEHKQGPEDKDGLALLWKQPGVSEGLGDLPWHRDCGMGGHASMCPTAVMSIFLGPNTPEAGEIRFLPGSWHSSFPFADGRSTSAPRGVAPAARPGDITLHYGDGLHVAPPPTATEGPFRSCILMGYGRRDGGHHLGGRHYNDVLLGSEDGQVKDMRSMANKG